MNDAEKAAWLSSRCGKLTASRMPHAMQYTAKGAEGADRKRLKIELLAERMTGDTVPHFVNSYMEWGLTQEPHAKAAYELRTGRLIAPAGFVDHPAIELFGATPDGFLPGAVIEFKCPATTTHLGWLLAGGVPEQHQPQILAQMACTGKEHAVFVSYDPRIKNERKQMHIVEWTPDRAEIEKVEEEAAKFLAEVDALFERVVNG
jgi:putative phage-type endonuclease